MVSLSTYINEAVEQYRLNEVIAPYKVQPKEIILQAPETWQESDIQMYINDLWLNKLPSGQDYAEKFFGVNHDSINDVYFKYDTFEHLTVEPKEYIEFDSKYNNKNSNTNEKLDYFKITNLMYFISFDRFDMVDVNDYNVKRELVKIFKTAESNYNNKYPIEIHFDEYSLEYRK